MSKTFLEPLVIDHPTKTGRWMVVLHNDDVTTFEDVIKILMTATGCSAEEAYVEAWEAHTYGKAPCHFAGRNECEIVAHMIGTIGVRTEVRPEWQE